jgi:hypothetical protein
MHSHTPDLAFTLTFAVLVVTTFVVSIASVDCCVVRSLHANCWAVRHGKSSPSPPPPPRRHCRHRRPPPPAASISSPPSSDGVGQAAATRGPLMIPVQGQPIHDQAVRAPPAAASASHVEVGATGHHLLPDPRHEARAPLTAAPAAVTARGGHRLRCRLCDPPSCPGGHRRQCCVGDDDVGRLPPPRSEGRGQGAYSPHSLDRPSPPPQF